MSAPKIEPIRGEQPLFATMGEQLRAIMNVEIDRRVDPRLTDVHRRAATIGGSEQVPSDGGFLLQPEFSRQIVTRMYEPGQILKRCTVLPTNTGGVAYPQIDEGSRIGGSRLGGVQGHWVDEGDPLNPPKLGTSLSEVPRFNLSTVVPHKVAVFMYVSDELARDSNAFEAWATYAGSQELTYKIEGAIISGTGAGMPQGILNSPALVTTPAATGQATSQASMTVIANSDGTSSIVMAAGSFAIGNTLTNTVPFAVNPDGSLQLQGVTKIASVVESLGTGANGKPFLTIGFGALPYFLFDDGT